MTKTYCEPKCNERNFPKPKGKHLGFVIACPKCYRLHTCRWMSLITNYPIRSMVFYWNKLDGEQ